MDRTHHLKECTIQVRPEGDANSEQHSFGHTHFLQVQYDVGKQHLRSKYLPLSLQEKYFARTFIKYIFVAFIIR
jgi:hypothetical protein